MAKELLDKQTKEHLKKQFEDLRDVVKVEFIHGENEERNSFIRSFFSELSMLSDKIIFEEMDIDEFNDDDLQIINTPTVFLGRDQGYKIEFVGTPAGYEAQTMIETIYLLSTKTHGFKDAELARLEAIDSPLLLESYVTTSCPHCPKSSLLITRFAIALPSWFHSRTIEASENMDLAREFSVSSVPQQVINRNKESITIGARKEAEMIDGILKFGSSQYEEIMRKKKEKELKQLIDEPNAPLDLTDNTFNKALEKYPLILVDFWAEWCGPCQMIIPVLKEIAHEWAGKIVIGKVNVDEQNETATRFRIQSIPTMKLFKDGKELDTIMGAMSKEDLILKLKNHI